MAIENESQSWCANEREAELRRLAPVAIYDMEYASRSQGGGDHLIVHDPEKEAFFRADGKFALSRRDADYEFLAKYAIWL